MGYVLGVDIGTTFTAAAIATDRGVEMCTLGDHAASIPTVVLIRPDGHALVGEAAQRRVASEPQCAAVAFKRRLGDPTPIVIGDVPYGAEALIAHVLRFVVDLVTAQQGARPGEVVLTHPAGFGEFKLDLLRQASQQAGIDRVTFLAEPQAAAIHYAASARLEEGRIVAVYDFGGGTFDAAVLRRTADGFETIGDPEGLERLGGVDLDHAVLRHTLRAVGLDDIEQDSAHETLEALARLREECRLAKEALSADSDATVSVALPGVATKVRITRSELEAMFRPRVADTIAALRRAVERAGIDMGDVDRILLVGGTSRIPMIAEMVRNETGIPVAIDVHPKHSVALGAAASGRTLLASSMPGRLVADAPAAPTESLQVPVAVAAAAHQADESLPSAATDPPPTPGPEPDGAPSTVRPAGPPAITASAATAQTVAHPKRRSIKIWASALAIAVLVLAVVLLSRLGGGSSGEAASPNLEEADSSAAIQDENATASSDEAGATGASERDVADEADADSVDEVDPDEPYSSSLPLGFRYANLDVSIDQFVVRRQDPEAFLAGLDPDDSYDPYGYMQLSVTNGLEYIPIALTGTSFVLFDDDGNWSEALHLDESQLVDPSGSGTLLLAFPLVDGFDPATTKLLVSDFDDTPLNVPLAGAERDDEPTGFGTIDAVVSVTGTDGARSDWNLGEAFLSADAGYDSTDYSGGQLTADRRAQDGLVWLNLPITIVAAADCECDGVGVDWTFVYVDVADDTYEAVNTFAEYLAPGDQIDVVLSFEIPLGYSEATLLVGPPDGAAEPERIAVSFE